MTIKVHHLRPAPGAKTAKTRVGRGEGSKGKTAGRGTKGTGARKNMPATFEGGQPAAAHAAAEAQGLQQPLPHHFQVVNVGQLADAVPGGRRHRRRRARRGRSGPRRASW